MIKTEPAAEGIRMTLDSLDADLHLLMSGRLLETEMRRTAVRQGISRAVVDSAIRPISLIEHEGADFHSAGLFKDRNLGSLDALHLATALRARVDAMMTSDQALARASESEGLPILTMPND
jgi:predicted nucleic acid-binding protein